MPVSGIKVPVGLPGEVRKTTLILLSTNSVVQIFHISGRRAWDKEVSSPLREAGGNPLLG